MRHAEGASGQESVRTHARLMDEVIFAARGSPPPTRTAATELTALVVTALGGYGGATSIRSDIDLMVVYDGS